MLEFNMVEIDNALKPVARFSLALFAALSIVHLLALGHWLMPPPWVLVVVVPLVIPGQILVVAGGIASGRELGDRRLSREERWRIVWQGLRTIPWWWLVVFCSLFYFYGPWTLIAHTMRFPGTVQNLNGQCVLWDHGDVVRALDETECMAARAGEIRLLSLGGMFFSLIHYLILWYGLPRRHEIVKRALAGLVAKC